MSDKEIISPSELISLVYTTKMRNQLSLFILAYHLPADLVNFCDLFLEDEEISDGWRLVLYDQDCNNIEISLQVESADYESLTLREHYGPEGKEYFDAYNSVWCSDNTLIRVERKLSNDDYTTTWHLVNLFVFNFKRQLESYRIDYDSPRLLNVEFMDEYNSPNSFRSTIEFEFLTLGGDGEYHQQSLRDCRFSLCNVVIPIPSDYDLIS